MATTAEDLVAATGNGPLLGVPALGAGHVSSSQPGLTIVIPALNEEESIGATVQRCLDARAVIREVGGIGRVEIIVVSDGSTDRTAAIAREIVDREADVQLIEFEKNRGYGAAIKAGFSQGTGDFVAFLDADGTCDPVYFAGFCRAMRDEQAAVVLGNRMGRDSKMPRVRRIGNWLYATLLGMLSGRAVEDTASGMRVLRRASLSQLYPLPDGLNFTPAMSARALFTQLKVVEVPMTYADRVGRSKLSVVKDGVRFLRSIIDAVLLFRPGRMFRAAAVVCGLIATAWGMYPLEFYGRQHRLEEWMVYRVMLCALLITTGFNFLLAGSICDRLLGMVFPGSRQMRSFFSQCLESLTGARSLVTGAVAMGVVGVWLVSSGLAEYASAGTVSLHWSRVAASSMCLQLCVAALVAAVIQRVIELWRAELPSRQTRSP